ncbi:unnamed protein product [Didymodactylos carnosus]|uniref:U-box domain-containing protein n=1 Tax=Didymodactylos carnosus TaxID=1234261 RepID=A0A814VN19_9BILA|nr:unnamed protein product [Didymodactylos carnosus]CAF1294417.1 unnamed protein product [Didymodactylos carnosus]CAF3953683.1 unnamed protein product [Didymodactylos carnosus]CAF4099567.1 unnamed protein product [Didymodactylos carnosus]
MDTNTQANIVRETLTCPITLEVFRDPVRATDGHVYERAAIIRWIETHGTSPLTREPLNVADLQVDEHLKYLASQRRPSKISSVTQDETVILPAFYGMGSDSTHPSGNTANMENLPMNPKKRFWSALCCLAIVICSGLLLAGLVTGFSIGLGYAVGGRGKLADSSTRTNVPGCDSPIKQHRDTAIQAIREADAFLFLTDGQRPDLTRDEINILKEIQSGHYQGMSRAVGIITKLDLCHTRKQYLDHYEKARLELINKGFLKQNIFAANRDIRFKMYKIA